jgi:DNA-binding transcriptional ArsR family regulator
MNRNSLPLAPTLWRTFRVIASAPRLRCLKTVLKQPDSTVEQVAKGVRISEAKASLALRALQSRGLVASRRQSRWVMYAPDPDASVISAAAVLSAVKSALLDEKITETKIILTVTAYTHPRRIEIVRALAFAEAVEPHSLSPQVGISLPALFRHLDNLSARGVVINTNGKYSLSKSKTKLAHDLLLIVLA